LEEEEIVMEMIIHVLYTHIVVKVDEEVYRFNNWHGLFYAGLILKEDKVIVRYKF